MAVHINNISIVLMSNDFEPGWLLHATVKELHLDGSIVHNAKTLLVTAALNDAHVKILRQCPQRKQSLEGAKLNQSQPCLIELSFGISLEGVLIAQGPLSVEKMQLEMSNTKIILHGGLYDFIRNSRKNYGIYGEGHEKEIDLRELLSEGEENDEDFQRLLPILPKVISSSLFLLK